MTAFLDGNLVGKFSADGGVSLLEEVDFEICDTRDTVLLLSQSADNGFSSSLWLESLVVLPSGERLSVWLGVGIGKDSCLSVLCVVDEPMEASSSLRGGV